MGKDISQSATTVELAKDTKSLCGTKHKIYITLKDSKIIKPITEENGYTKEQVKSFEEGLVTPSIKSAIVPMDSKIFVSFTPSDTSGVDTKYHRDSASLHKIRITIKCDGETIHQDDITGNPDDSVEKQFLITKAGRWTIDAKPLSAGDCATPDEETEIVYLDVQPLEEGWVVDNSVLDEDNGNEEIEITNELTPILTIGIIGLGSLLLTKLLRKKKTKEAENISTLYTQGKWRRPVRFRNLDNVNKYDGAIELQGYDFCPAKIS